LLRPGHHVEEFGDFLAAAPLAGKRKSMHPGDIPAIGASFSEQA
jgi:hypothetical protein